MNKWKVDNIGNCILSTKNRNPQKLPDKLFTYIDVSSVDNKLFKIVDPSLLYGREAPSRARKIVKEHDVIFATVRPTLKRVAYITKEFDNQICSTGFCVLRTNKELESKFLYYWLLTDFIFQEVKKTQRGASYPAIRDSDLKSFKIYIPLINEQKIIADVLSLVQNAIAQQEKAIALTTELKKALMQKLFTEGTRNEPQKQTEIGLIPESWDVVKLNDYCKFLSGGTPSKQKQEYWDGDIPWVSPKDMKLPRLDQTINYITKEGLNNGSKLSPIGSILIVIRGMILAKNVPVAMLNLSMAFNQDLKAIILQKLINNEFLLYSLQYHKESLLSKVGTSAHGTKTLSTGEIKQFQIANPCQEEQNSIISIFKNLEYKVELQKRRFLVLQDLFQTLLHQLMTAKIRVSELNLDSLNLDIEE